MPSVLTGDDCRCIATSLRSTYSMEGLQTSLERSGLGRDLAAVASLSGCHGNALINAGIPTKDPRQMRAAVLAILLRPVALACEAFRGVPGFKGRLKDISHLRILPGEGHNDAARHARAILLEIELAARLRWAHWSVEFREPDIILNDGKGGLLALACKRPQKEKTIGGNVQDACGQIAKASVPGIVAVGLEALLPSSLLALSKSAVSSEVCVEMDGVITRNSADIRKALSKYALAVRPGGNPAVVGAMDIIFVTHMPSITKHEGGGVIDSHFHAMHYCQTQDPDSALLARALIGIISTDDRELRARSPIG